MQTIEPERSNVYLSGNGRRTAQNKRYPMSFDQIIDRRGMNVSKWDNMEKAFGVSSSDGLAMWVADMDFAAPDFLQAEMKRLTERGHYGYFSGIDTYLDAVATWMQTRHGWAADPEWMFTTYGLGHGIAMSLHALTQPGDHVAIFSPVYHEFSGKIRTAGRKVTELPLAKVDGVYTMDFECYETLMTGNETMMIISSPHNPAGRVWTQDELTAIADFCERHDLILISDEIHHDLTFPGYTHIPMTVAAPQILDRLIMMTSASKSFNIAGARTGCVSIPDPELRKRFGDFFKQFDVSPNLFGVFLSKAAYSPEGAAWIDHLRAYLQGNFETFKAGVDAIPGLTAMPMQATYLAWVDFEGTGMARDEFSDRVYKQARIAVTPGHTLGMGGETYHRFNLAAPRARIEDAVTRLQSAFSDLQ